MVIFAFLAKTGKNIDEAAALILSGKLVAIPTETVYGLAANALDERAVLAVFAAKERPFFDPLIIHLPNLATVSEYAMPMHEKLKELAQKFWPGPLTLLLDKRAIVPDLVTSGLPRVAIRVPDHDLTHRLLEKIKVPLAAPSANPFGYVSPTEPAHVEKQLGGKIAYILDGGPSSVGLESTIVGEENGQICVYRLGGLSLEDIERVTGKAKLMINNSSDPAAPGQLKSHYAPRKPLVLGNIEQLIVENADKKTAIISFGNRVFHGNVQNFQLSQSGDLNEAALNLFKKLREADESSADVVIAEMVPDTGLGRAINDRLRRAATPH